MVRTTHTGASAPMVLKRSALPAAQPVPQPSARTVKYGTPVAGLVGAVSVLMLPVPTTPTCSPTMLNAVVLVNTSAQRSVLAPWLVTSMGASTSLYLPVVAAPLTASAHAPCQVAWPNSAAV